MDDADEFDIVVIGAGPGGEAASVHAAKLGARVALVERELVGGECPYWGCMPSKALLRPSELLAEARRTPGVRELLVDRVVDAHAVLARRDEVVRDLDDESHAKRVARHGVKIVRGVGRIAGEHTVVVELASGAGTRTLRAMRAVIAAPGSRAAMPPIPGLDCVDAWTNREATLAKTIPRRLAIVGGGVIAVELAQAFASLGSTVTILEAGDRVLAREEPRASELVTESLREHGVTIRCGVNIERVERDDRDAVTVHSADSDPVVADELLVATGRAANTEDLGLESVGVSPGDGGIVEVADCMNVPGHGWLFVVGDANGRAQLTHTAVYQAKVAARNAMGIPTDCVEDAVAAPRVTFTDPNVCGVGHTLASARDAGIDAIALDRDPQRTAGASFHGHGTDGFARLVVDRDAGLVVGATFVGSDLVELLHGATIAIVGEVPLERLRHCVAPFPTRSDVWNRLLDLAELEHPGTIV